MSGLQIGTLRIFTVIYKIEYFNPFRLKNTFWWLHTSIHHKNLYNTNGINDFLNNTKVRDI